MSNEWEFVRKEMLDEYEFTGGIRVKAWIEQNPDLHDQIEGLIQLLPESAIFESLPDFSDTARDIALPAIRADVVRRAAEREARYIGHLIREARPLRRSDSAYPTRETNTVESEILGWVAGLLFTVRLEVTRMDAMKVIAVLRDPVFPDLFENMRMYYRGPFDRGLKGAETIAKDRRWFYVDGYHYIAGGKIQAPVELVRAYLASASEAEEVVKYLGGYSTDDLELISTVLWMAREISPDGRGVDAARVMERIGENPRTKAKLRRSVFSRAKVQEALELVENLHLYPSKT
jgi:hypothetical protein